MLLRDLSSRLGLSGWLGGTVLGVAAAGAAGVLAQPQLTPDRAGQTPVEKPAVVSIEARTAGKKVEGQTQFGGDEEDGFGGLLPPGFEDDPRFEELFRR